MTINYETIDFNSSECFRVLRWHEDVNRVQVLDSSLGEFTPMNGTGGRWHWHQEVEITFVATGHGIRVVGDETSEISGNAGLVMLGRGLPHYWNFLGPSSGVCIQLCDLRLMKSLSEKARTEMLALIDNAAYGIEIRAPFCDQATQILLNLSQRPPSTDIEIYGLLFQLLGTLASIHHTAIRQISSIRFDGHQANANYAEMQKAVHWIMENYASEVQLQSVLDLVNMSKSCFSRHFLKCTGVSFSQFVNQVRISNASRLLHTTQDSVSAIAFHTGFANLSNFNRIFRKLKGVSPTEYRKRMHTWQEAAV